MHFASTRVGRWDVNDDGDDDHDDDNDADDDDGDDNNYVDKKGAQVAEYDDYEYELKKEGVSEERTDGAYISVKYCHSDGDGGDDFDVFFIIFDRNQVEKICNTFVIFNYHKFMRQNVPW